MSHPKAPDFAGLLMGLLIAQGGDATAVLEACSHTFGPIHQVSEPMPFDQTEYYAPEMGDGIVRRFVLFETLVDQEQLANIKLLTNAMENDFLKEGNRQVNLDPGVLTASHLVLASGKDAPHRVYLGQGIFAELSLVYQCGDFLGMKWTYPDYLDQRTLAFLAEARKYILLALNRRRKGA